MDIYGSFYGREISYTQTNAFKIYVTDSGLYFARISDRMNPEIIGKKLMFVGGWAGRTTYALVTLPLIRKFKETEEIYDALDLDSAEFLSREPKNFHLSKSDTRELQLVKAKGLIKSNILPGTLKMPHNGKMREFAITSTESGAEIERMLRLSMPNIGGSLA